MKHTTRSPEEVRMNSSGDLWVVCACEEKNDLEPDYAALLGNTEIKIRCAYCGGTITITASYGIP